MRSTACSIPTTIARIEIRTSERALAHTDRADPKSALEAKFSVQYCVARALDDGKVVPRALRRRRAARTPAMRIAARQGAVVALYRALFLRSDRFDAVVKVTLNDGQRARDESRSRRSGARCENPIPADALNAKFGDCAARVLDARTADAVCRADLGARESLGAVRDLTALLEAERDRDRRRAGVQMRVAHRDVDGVDGPRS